MRAATNSDPEVAPAPFPRTARCEPRAFGAAKPVVVASSGKTRHDPLGNGPFGNGQLGNGPHGTGPLRNGPRQGRE